MKKTSHHCHSFVVTCIDFRFQNYLNRWTKKLKGGFDRLSIAGAVKNLPFILDQIDISYRLHHIKEVYLVNHEDCGAYGKEGTYKRHQKDLQKAQKVIKKKYPDLKITLLFLTLDGSFLPQST